MVMRLNGYEDIDRSVFIKLNKRHKAALVNAYCKLDTRKYSLSKRKVNNWKKNKPQLF